MAKRKAVRGAGKKRTATAAGRGATKSGRGGSAKAARKTAAKATRKRSAAASRRSSGPAARKTAAKGKKSKQRSTKATARRTPARGSAAGRTGRATTAAKSAKTTKSAKAVKAAKSARSAKSAKTSRSAPSARTSRAARSGHSVPTRKTPALNRNRRTVREDEDLVQTTPPSSLDLDRSASATRSGRRNLRDRYDEHTETGPAITAGDVDADWESAYSVGDEAPGGDNPTPDQDIVDDIGRAVGVEYQDNEELKGAKKVEERDKHRWELDPASSEDWKNR